MIMTEVYDPYDVWKQQVVTFLLCRLHNNFIKECVDKNIAKKICMYIPIDLIGWQEWNGERAMMRLIVWYRPPYEWIWTVENKHHGRPPCLICLRPCILDEEEEGFKGTYKLFGS